MGSQGVVGEVQRGVWMAAEHAGGSHAMQVGVVAAHWVGQGVGAHASHPHASSETGGTTVYPWWEEASDAGTFLL